MANFMQEIGENAKAKQIRELEFELASMEVERERFGLSPGRDSHRVKCKIKLRKLKGEE